MNGQPIVTTGELWALVLAGLFVFGLLTVFAVASAVAEHRADEARRAAARRQRRTTVERAA